MAAAAPIEGEYDYIVVGAGSARCVLANRLLTKDGKHSVLVVEAGGQDDWFWIDIPVGYLYTIGNPRTDWVLPHPRARGRPQWPKPGLRARQGARRLLRDQRDDLHARAGRRLRPLALAWAFRLVVEGRAAVLPEEEDHFVGANEHTGRRRTAHGGAAREVGDPRRVARCRRRRRHQADPRIQPRRQRGLVVFHMNQQRGRRWWAAGLLRPVLGRPNLQLITQGLAEGIVFDGSAPAARGGAERR